MSEQIMLEPDTRRINVHGAREDTIGETAESEVLSAPAVIPRHGKRQAIFRAGNDAPNHYEERITERELQTTYMLLAWIVEEWNATPETAQSIAKVRFGIDDMAKLTRSNYDKLTKLLVDLYIDDCGLSAHSMGVANGNTIR